MIENFQKFGEFVSIDITYNLVSDRNPHYTGDRNGQKESWGLALFCGKNANNRIVPYAFCFLSSETKEQIGNMIRSFIDLMGK